MKLKLQHITLMLKQMKLKIEEQLMSNNIDVVVATSALSMGFDKPDLGFVYHFQTPQSVVHYYQQVGRAGRAFLKHSEHAQRY